MTDRSRHTWTTVAALVLNWGATAPCAGQSPIPAAVEVRQDQGSPDLPMALTPSTMPTQDVPVSANQALRLSPHP